MKKRDIYRNLGIFFKNRRQKAGLSQSEVGAALGYSSSQFISNFERGLCSVPLPKMKVLMSLYGISFVEMSKILIENQKRLIAHYLLKKSKSPSLKKRA